ncbi:MAG TPA: murein transglycosylase A [Stellaceae bacterium]|nr:murein transglycosylase A [Stellaceae bacterium]
MTPFARAAGAVLVALGLLSCGPQKKPPDRLTLAATGFDRLAGWREDDLSAALPALRRSCEAVAKLPDEHEIGPRGLAGTAADWRQPCAAAEALDPADKDAVRRFFEAGFVPYRLANNDEAEGLFTGYYEAELHGARSREGPFTTPILKRPPDLVMVELGLFRPDWRGQRIAGRVENGQLKPYASRADIERGALAKRGLELFWVDDPVDAFFLQIQGSGRILLPDGSVVQLGYDGQNGRPYVPIGKVLVDRGALPREDVTMQSIRAWLHAHPEEAAAVMDANPSYVFFREMKGEGPIGAEGVPLTPGRSLAVDRAFLPLGVPLWLDLADDKAPGGRLRRLVIAQDTGGAIRGPVRGDLFWGYGPEAARRAGMMKDRGAYYMLLPRAVAARRDATS